MVRPVKQALFHLEAMEMIEIYQTLKEIVLQIKGGSSLYGESSWSKPQVDTLELGEASPPEEVVYWLLQRWNRFHFSAPSPEFKG